MCSDRNVPSMPTYLPPIGGRHEHVRLLHSLHSWETGLENGRARKAVTSFGTSYMSFNTYKIDA